MIAHQSISLAFRSVVYFLGSVILNECPDSGGTENVGNDWDVVESGRCEEVHISDINVVAYEKD